LVHLHPPRTEEAHTHQLETDLQALLDRMDNIQTVLKQLRSENEGFNWEAKGADREAE
jgi:hypothetical protein